MPFKKRMCVKQRPNQRSQDLEFDPPATDHIDEGVRNVIISIVFKAFFHSLFFFFDQLSINTLKCRTMNLQLQKHLCNLPFLYKVEMICGNCDTGCMQLPRASLKMWKEPSFHKQQMKNVSYGALFVQWQSVGNQNPHVLSKHTLSAMRTGSLAWDCKAEHFRRSMSNPMLEIKREERFRS